MDSFKTPAVVLVGLLSGLGRQYSLRSSPPDLQEEMWTGWFTWGALCVTSMLIMFRRRPSGSVEPSQVMKTLRESVWPIRWSILVLSVVAITAQIVRSQGILPFAGPIVTLAALFLSTIMPAQRDVPHLPEVEEEKSSQDTQSWRVPGMDLSPLRMPIWIPVNMVLLLLLAGSISYRDVQISGQVANTILFLIAETTVFTLLPRMSRVSNSSSASPTNALLDWDLLGKISLFLLAFFSSLLAYSIYTFPEATMPNMATFLRAASEAGWWFSILSLSTDILSTTAVTLDTVAASFDLVMSSGEGLGILLASFSAVGSLWQSVTSIPQSRKSRNWLYLLILIPILGLGHTTYHESKVMGRPSSHAGEHPLAHIVHQAQQDFSDMLNRQSRTLEQATKEYIRRYGRKPPPNFDKWFELAAQYDFLLVDEFDRVTHALEPFWGVPPLVIRSIVQETLRMHFPQDLSMFQIRGHAVNESTGHFFSRSMARLLQPGWANLLPDMTLVANAWDEPNVVIPRDVLDMAIQQARSSRGQQLSEEESSAKPPRFLDLGGQNPIEDMILSCPADSPARNPVCNPPGPKDPLPFVRNRTHSMDVCENCSIQRQLGLLMSPNTMRLTHSMVPVWSQSKPSSFNDVIFPSPFYLSAIGDYNEEEDPDWADKESRLYWVGSATGGWATLSTWQEMQRQRLALMAQAGSYAAIRLLRESRRGEWVSYNTDMTEISSLFNVRIVATTAQCDPATCDAERKAFGLENGSGKDTREAAWKHKFVLDIDGNSYSGRFYTLLRSKSTVFKQAIFQEAHDDRLMPWIHYVPVSSSMKELPEVVRFLANTIEGDEIASKIAEDGRDWAWKALRPIDMQLVFLRMLMEYGRIIDPERDSFA